LGVCEVAGAPRETGGGGARGEPGDGDDERNPMKLQLTGLGTFPVMSHASMAMTTTPDKGARVMRILEV
jgi:hypothetical protein